jgi:IS5 family transposase
MLIGIGSKRHILTDKDGIPLSTVITSANTHDVTVATNTHDVTVATNTHDVTVATNTHDVTVATNTIDNIVIKRPPPSSSIAKYRNKKKNKKKQNLCLDKAYHSKEIEQEVIKRGYIPHIRHRREEKKYSNRHPAVRRWVVERTNSSHKIQKIIYKV